MIELHFLKRLNKEVSYNFERQPQHHDTYNNHDLFYLCLFRYKGFRLLCMFLIRLLNLIKLIYQRHFYQIYHILSLL